MPVETAPCISIVATKLQNAVSRSTRRAPPVAGVGGSAVKPVRRGRSGGTKRRWTTAQKKRLKAQSPSNAPRQPNSSISTCVRGMKTVLARPPRMVMKVMPRRTMLPRLLRQDGKARLVEDGAHAGAEPDPDENEDRIALDLRPERKKAGRGNRARRHDDPAVAAVDQTPDREGADAGGDQAEGIGRRERRPRPAEFLPHGIEEEGEGVEDRAPGHELRRREKRHESPGKAVGRLELQGTAG